MPIDWLRIKPEFLATDGDRSYWRYPSRDVIGDMAELESHLQTYPKHQLIACKDSVLAIFDGATLPSFPRIGGTIDRIADTIIREGKITPED